MDIDKSHSASDHNFGSVIVTGAASGIGRSIAFALGRAGYSVGAFDRDADGVTATVDSLNSNRPSPGALALIGDVTSEEDVTSAVQRLQARFGPLKAAVASAGVWTKGTVVDTSESLWHHTFNINTFGAFLLARTAVRAFAEIGGGSFVAIASDVALQGSQDCVAYVASKHAVLGMVRAIALDHGCDGIRANAVCPGFVATLMTEQIFAAAPDSALKARLAEQPTGRFARPDEVADLVEYLVGKHSSFINGAAVTCDGGSSAGYYQNRRNR